MSRRLVVVVSGMTVLVALVDFPTRVLVTRTLESRPFVIPQPEAVSDTASREAIDARLRQWFPRPPEPEVPTERGMTLRGVFGVAGGSRAIIQLDPIGDLPAQYLTVSRGDAVSDGWVAENVETQRVILRRSDETRELVIFRTQTK